MPKSLKPLWISAAILGLAMLAPGLEATPQEAGAPTAEPRVLATWKDGRITQDELDGWRTFSNGGQAEEPREPSEPADAEIRELASWKILVALAEEGRLDEDRRTRFQLEAARQMALVPVLRREVVSEVTVAEEEVEAIRREHPEAFRRPRKLKLRNIYKHLGTSAEAGTVRRRMQEIHAALLAGAAFEDLAEAESESQSAPRGGALGYVNPDELPPPVAEVVRSLSPGEVSNPVEHGDGLSIFLCEEVREAHVPTPEEVREKVRSQLARLRSREAWAAYQAELFEAAAPRIEPGSPTTVLEMPGYRLDAGDLAALATLGPGRADGTLGPQRARELLRTWTMNVLSVRRAVELGLDQAPDITLALHWRRQEILARTELARRLGSVVPDPTDEVLRNYLDDHRNRYRELAAYDLRVIELGKPDEGAAGRVMLREATAVARGIATGELTFEEAARRHSIHPSAPVGGEIGWRPKREVAAAWGPTAKGAILQLSPGEATPLLHLDSGLWIFALEGEREARNLSFEEARDQVRDAWVGERLPEIEETILRQLLEDVHLEIRPSAPPPRVVRWSTASEFESYGFHVFRGLSADGPFQRLTKEPILGAGTTDVPHSYEYEDANAEPGVVYYYYVEAVSTSGRTRRLTPVKASKGERK